MHSLSDEPERAQASGCIINRVGVVAWEVKGRVAVADSAIPYTPHSPNVGAHDRREGEDEHKRDSGRTGEGGLGFTVCCYGVKIKGARP